MNKFYGGENHFSRRHSTESIEMKREIEGDSDWWNRYINRCGAKCWCCKGHITGNLSFYFGKLLSILSKNANNGTFLSHFPIGKMHSELIVMCHRSIPSLPTPSFTVILVKHLVRDGIGIRANLTQSSIESWMRIANPSTKMRRLNGSKVFGFCVTMSLTRWCDVCVPCRPSLNLTWLLVLTFSACKSQCVNDTVLASQHCVCVCVSVWQRQTISNRYVR